MVLHSHKLNSAKGMCCFSGGRRYQCGDFHEALNLALHGNPKYYFVSKTMVMSSQPATRSLLSMDLTDCAPGYGSGNNGLKRFFKRLRHWQHASNPIQYCRVWPVKQDTKRQWVAYVPKALQENGRRKIWLSTICPLLEIGWKWLKSDYGRNQCCHSKGLGKSSRTAYIMQTKELDNVYQDTDIEFVENKKCY